jgi:hypothetical protein
MKFNSRGAPTCSNKGLVKGFGLNSSSVAPACSGDTIENDDDHPKASDAADLKSRRRLVPILSWAAKQSFGRPRPFRISRCLDTKPWQPQRRTNETKTNSSCSGIIFNFLFQRENTVAISACYKYKLFNLPKSVLCTWSRWHHRTMMVIGIVLLLFYYPARLVINPSNLLLLLLILLTS